MHKTVKGLIFYPIGRLINYPTTVSYVYSGGRHKTPGSEKDIVYYSQNKAVARVITCIGCPYPDTYRM